MLEGLLGSKSKEQVLIFLSARNEGYAREISSFFDTSLSPIQGQLDKLEISGILYSKFLGRTKLFYMNPRYPFYQELKKLLDKSISFLPDDEKEKLLIVRKRPRRAGKPL